MFESKKKYILYSVPKNPNSIQIITFRVKSIRKMIAQLQDPELEDIIIGREIVFDLFDIEFKQADEEIVFRKR